MPTSFSVEEYKGKAPLEFFQRLEKFIVIVDDILTHDLQVQVKQLLSVIRVFLKISFDTFRPFFDAAGQDHGDVFVSILGHVLSRSSEQRSASSRAFHPFVRTLRFFSCFGNDVPCTRSLRRRCNFYHRESERSILRPLQRMAPGTRLPSSSSRKTCGSSVLVLGTSRVTFLLALRPSRRRRARAAAWRWRSCTCRRFFRHVGPRSPLPDAPLSENDVRVSNPSFLAFVDSCGQE